MNMHVIKYKLQALVTSDSEFLKSFFIILIKNVNDDSAKRKYSIEPMRSNYYQN